MKRYVMMLLCMALLFGIRGVRAEDMPLIEWATRTPEPVATFALEAPVPTAPSTPEPTKAPTATPKLTPTPTTTLEPIPTTVVVHYGETHEFTTEIKSDGTARIVPQEGEAYETLYFALTMKDYMLPSDFASKWGSVYKLQGTEAGASFELLLINYEGAATIVPQNIIKIVFQSESGNTENPGFQLMDAEIAGQTDVVVKPSVPKTLWKRYTYTNAGEEMKYLAVTSYNDGFAQTLLFELQSSVVPTPDPKDLYKSLTIGDISDAVIDLQKRLIELGYLSGDADGKYGKKTAGAVKATQKFYGMEQTGTASPEFQARLFSPDQPETTPSPEPSEESPD